MHIEQTPEAFAVQGAYVQNNNKINWLFNRKQIKLWRIKLTSYLTGLYLSAAMEHPALLELFQVKLRWDVRNG